MMYASGNVQSAGQALLTNGGMRVSGSSQIASATNGGNISSAYEQNDFRERMRQTTPAFSGFARNWISARADNEIPIAYHAGLVPDTVFLGTNE